MKNSVKESAEKKATHEGLKKRDSRKTNVILSAVPAFHTRTEPDECASDGEDDDEKTYIEAYNIVARAKAKVGAKDKEVEDSADKDVETLARPNILEQDASQKSVAKKESQLRMRRTKKGKKTRKVRGMRVVVQMNKRKRRQERKMRRRKL